MDKNNLVSNHLWPALLGAGCSLPEIVDGKPLWWLVAGALVGWVVWRGAAWWEWWVGVGGE